MERSSFSIRRWVATVVVIAAFAGEPSFRRDSGIGQVTPSWARPESQSPSRKTRCR